MKTKNRKIGREGEREGCLNKYIDFFNLKRTNTIIPQNKN
jgi:hypothetical protein|tara:strand:- start:563 stop:682 length:120 start_codon:yes stop_codon:yes gene_type:complete